MSEGKSQTTQETRLWRAGYEACLNGSILRDMPAVLSTNGQADWIDGWCKADRDQNGAYPERIR